MLHDKAHFALRRHGVTIQQQKSIYRGRTGLEGARVSIYSHQQLRNRTAPTRAAEVVFSEKANACKSVVSAVWAGHRSATG